MYCSLCHKPEFQHQPDGTVVEYRLGIKIKAIMCGSCIAILLGKGIAVIPWDGIVPKKNNDQQPIILKRRKGV
jgi:hypothetical protein